MASILAWNLADPFRLNNLVACKCIAAQRGDVVVDDEDNLGQDCDMVQNFKNFPDVHSRSGIELNTSLYCLTFGNRQNRFY